MTMSCKNTYVHTFIKIATIRANIFGYNRLLSKIATIRAIIFGYNRLLSKIATIRANIFGYKVSNKRPRQVITERKIVLTL